MIVFQGKIIPLNIIKGKNKFSNIYLTVNVYDKADTLAFTYFSVAANGVYLSNLESKKQNVIFNIELKRDYDIKVTSIGFKNVVIPKVRLKDSTVVNVYLTEDYYELE